MIGAATDLPEMDAAVRAVCFAARLTRSVRANFVAGSELTKTDASPVTKADFAAQCLIALYLRAKLPGEFRLLAEEDAATLREGGDSLIAEVTALVNAHFPFEAEGEAFTAADIFEALESAGDAGGREGGFWFLDPIDGTKGCLRGGQYAIGLGRIEQGRAVLAVVGCPNLPAVGGDPETDVAGPGYLFCATPDWAGSLALPAVEGLLAQPVVWPEAMETLRVDASGPLVVTESVSSYQRHGSFWAGYPCLQNAGATRLDSMAKYCLVARGDCQAYLRGVPSAADAYHDSGIWDHVAALLVTAAGGRVTNYRGEALDFGEGRALPRNEGVLATSGALHDEILASIRGVAG